MARRLAREEGILVGGSTGLNVWLALEVAREVDDPDAHGRHHPVRHRRALPVQASSTTSGCRRTRCSRRRGLRWSSCSSGGPPNAPALVSVAPAAAVRQALNLMSTWGVSQIPVVENGQSVGGLIEGTLMTRALAQPSLLDRPVREVMEPPFPEVEASTPTDRVGAMLTRESPAALVRKDGKLIGIVSRYDVLQQLIGTR